MYVLIPSLTLSVLPECPTSVTCFSRNLPGQRHNQTFECPGGQHEGGEWEQEHSSFAISGASLCPPLPLPNTVGAKLEKFQAVGGRCWDTVGRTSSMPQGPRNLTRAALHWGLKETPAMSLHLVPMAGYHGAAPVVSWHIAPTARQHRAAPAWLWWPGELWSCFKCGKDSWGGGYKIITVPLLSQHQGCPSCSPNQLCYCTWALLCPGQQQQCMGQHQWLCYWWQWQLSMSVHPVTPYRNRIGLEREFKC